MSKSDTYYMIVTSKPGYGQKFFQVTSEIQIMAWGLSEIERDPLPIEFWRCPERYEWNKVYPETLEGWTDADFMQACINKLSSDSRTFEMYPFDILKNSIDEFMEGYENAKKSQK